MHIAPGRDDEAMQKLRRDASIASRDTSSVMSCDLLALNVREVKNNALAIRRQHAVPHP